jgi:methylmalonyl-CoA mutase N-terminal domain/subunit
MSKKREQALEAQIAGLRHALSERDEARERGMIQALREMSAEEFTIVTHAGRAIRARATEVHCDRSVEFRLSGLIEFGASIVMRPMGEEG